MLFEKEKRKFHKRSNPMHKACSLKTSYLTVEYSTSLTLASTATLESWFYLNLFSVEMLIVVAIFSCFLFIVRITSSQCLPNFLNFSS